MRRLEGKVAFVTGASRGIGAAIVKRLVAEGAHVALAYAKSPDQEAAVAKAAEALGVKAPMLKVDSGDADALIAAIDHAAKSFGA